MDEHVVVRKFRITTQYGAINGKTQSKEVKYYNLDVIIAVGYRIKSIQGVSFRQWTTIKYQHPEKLPTIELVDGGVKVTVWRDHVTSLSQVEQSENKYINKILS
ncbi:MAG: RhuM family protein [Parabacteroides sp.]